MYHHTVEAEAEGHCRDRGNLVLKDVLLILPVKVELTCVLVLQTKVRKSITSDHLSLLDLSQIELYIAQAVLL